MKKPIPFGKYLLLERVNVGGMAEVFLAKSFGLEGVERLAAIKRILPTMVEDEEFIQMFLDEAKISVQLNHANVVNVHDLGRHDESFFIAMEYVSGKDLRHLLERYRKRREMMPTAQAVYIASKICEGLDYAHRKKDARGMDLHIVHRDVSPQNILLSYDGEVKLIDFGIAKAANRAQKTQAGILKGKFGYMSPEQVRGQPIDHRSDIFAVGVILYEMLTGEKLFVGESDFSTLEKVRNADVLPPRQYNVDIPVGLEKVVLKALAGEVEARYQWCSDLQEDLQRYLLSGNAVYSARNLSQYLREAFAEDFAREKERLDHAAQVQRPDAIEISGVTTSAVARAQVDEADQRAAARAAPQPRMTQGEMRAAAQPRMTQGEVRAAPQPRMTQGEVRAAPQPRMTQGEVRAAAQPRMTRSEMRSAQPPVAQPAAPAARPASPSRPAPAPAPAAVDPYNPVIPPPEDDELDYEPTSDRTEIFRPAFDPSEPPAKHAPLSLGDDDEPTATPVAAPAAAPSLRTGPAASRSAAPAPAPRAPEPDPEDHEGGEEEVAATVIGMKPPVIARAAPQPAPRDEVEDDDGPMTLPPGSRAHGSPERHTPVPQRRMTAARPAARAPASEKAAAKPARNAAPAAGGSKLRKILLFGVAPVVVLFAVAAVVLRPGAAATGQLVVLAEPSDSVEITLDDVPMQGGAPVTVPAGDHVLVAKASGYETYTQPVRVKGGDPVVVQISLERSAGAGVGDGKDEVPMPPTAGTDTPSEPVKPAAAVEAPSKPPVRDEPKVADAKPPEPPVKPEPPAKPEKVTRDLRVESEPAGADILINGKSQGRTPKTLKALDPAKVKTVEVSLKGYKKAAVTVDWDAERPETSVFAALESNEPPKPVKPPEPVKTAQPAKAVEPVKAAEPAKATQPVKPPEPAKVAEPVKPPEPAKPPEPVKAAEPAKAADKKPADKAPKGLGNLVTMSRPVAKVSVDGRDTGRWTPIPPAQPLELPAGDHTLTYTAADGRKATRKVSVPVGETVKVVGVDDFE